jgi:hypothetical protein
MFLHLPCRFFFHLLTALNEIIAGIKFSIEIANCLIMELKRVLLNNTKYHEFLGGQEVDCFRELVHPKDIQQGEHIMVYKDSIAAKTGVTAPTREKQSDYIGVEGTVTAITILEDITNNNHSIQTITVKKL